MSHMHVFDIEFVFHGNSLHKIVCNNIMHLNDPFRSLEACKWSLLCNCQSHSRQWWQHVAISAQNDANNEWEKAVYMKWWGTSGTYCATTYATADNIGLINHPCLHATLPFLLWSFWIQAGVGSPPKSSVNSWTTNHWILPMEIVLRWRFPSTPSCDPDLIPLSLT